MIGPSRTPLLCGSLATTPLLEADADPRVLETPAKLDSSGAGEAIVEEDSWETDEGPPIPSFRVDKMV